MKVVILLLEGSEERELDIESWELSSLSPNKNSLRDPLLTIMEKLKLRNRLEQKKSSR